MFIPEGMNFISVMKDSYHDTDFGHFRSEVTKVDNHHIKVLQEIKINNGRYPKERYREFCDFINNIKNGLSGQVVLN